MIDVKVLHIYISIPRPKRQTKYAQYLVATVSVGDIHGSLTVFFELSRVAAHAILGHTDVMLPASLRRVSVSMQSKMVSTSVSATPCV